jgi:RsiW-degrading membrane proteinase PrsW (M82 family)
VTALLERDTRPRNVLSVALVLSGIFGYGMLLDAVKPALSSPVSWVDFTDLPPPPIFTAVRVCVLVSWAIALGIGVLAMVRLRLAPDPVSRARTVRGSQVAATVVLLLPFPIFPVDVLIRNWWAAAICVPTSALALWGVHLMQRYRRMPLGLPLAGFGWGALIATGIAGSMNGWFRQYGAAYLVDFRDVLTDQSALNATINRVITAMSLNAGFFEELGKGAGVAVLYLLFRHHIDNLVSGVVLGAAVGLGFNWSESMLYMGAGNGEGAVYQYWGRQTLGLMAAHTAFTAMIGAGFGIARQLSDRRSKLLAIGSGFLVAASAHFANNALMPRAVRVRDNLFGDNPWLTDLVAMPLTIIVLQGPVVVLYILLLRRGLRGQVGGLTVELSREAQTGLGAVTPDEIPALLGPALRFFVKFRAFRQGGVAAYRHVARLHAAQFDLAMQRWHRTRWEVDPRSQDEAALRDIVLRLKIPRLAPDRPAVAEVPA